MKEKNVICYAYILGNCSGKQSNEHYFTQGMFSSNEIEISGQKWLQGTKKTVSKKKLGLKILCDTHNKALGKDVDINAIKIFRLFDEYLSKADERGKLKRSVLWKKNLAVINGLTLERYAIKYLLGVVFEEPESRWHPNNSTLIEPPTKALNALFEKIPLQYPMGLYHISGLRETFQNQESLGMTTILHPDSGLLAGGMLTFRNLQFLIWLCEDDLTRYSFATQTGFIFGPEEHQLKPQYHCETFTISAKGKISGILQFNWSN
jgi:hypothetical protein